MSTLSMTADDMSVSVVIILFTSSPFQRYVWSKAYISEHLLILHLESIRSRMYGQNGLTFGHALLKAVVKSKRQHYYGKLASYSACLLSSFGTTNPQLQMRMDSRLSSKPFM